MLPKFIEDCSRLLSDRAADSVRCMGFCAHCTCCSTVPACKLQIIQKEQWPPDLKFEPSADIMSWERCVKLFWNLFEAKYSFWIKSCTRKKTKIFCRKSCPTF